MLDSIKHKSKFGFTLFEVVVTMSIVAIFIAACSNVFTLRHKKRAIAINHGRYECYRKQDGTLVEREFSEGAEIVPEQSVGSSCKFKPPKKASYLIITAVGGGGYGGNTNGGSAGNYSSTFLSTTSHWLEMVPGWAASSAAASGTNTFVYDIGVSGTSSRKTILNLSGGRSDSSNVLRFKDCTIATQAYNCGMDPVCTLHVDEPGVTDSVEVSYCIAPAIGSTIDPSTINTVSIPFITSLPLGDRNYDDGCNTSIMESFRTANKKITSIKDSAIGMTPTQMAEGGLTYTYNKIRCKTPDDGLDVEEIVYFRLNLSVDGNYSSDPDSSPLNGYINTLDIKGGIAADNGKTGNLLRRYSTGDGGAKREKGGHGAVMIIW